ncbi:MAG TPA: penicillin-binding transpeptidase domain-containing protein [Vicinamibacterales bacterium]|nr:penicillin-binding transpeptidase domain-containing protein [Vicinamibacterales bacterium]
MTSWLGRALTRQRTQAAGGRLARLAAAVGFGRARRRTGARAEASPRDQRAILRRRVGLAALGLGLWAAGIEARLVYLQIFRHADLVARAELQQMRTIPSPGKRGDILDRRGRVLATSVDADSVYAVPREINEPADAAARLCAALGDCSAKDRKALAERLTGQKAFAWVRRQVSPEASERVANLNLDGVGFTKESRRFYPNKDLAASLLGYVGLDNAGLGGLEATYDSQIRGKAGTILVHTDARRHVFSRVEHPPTSGASVELTIDEYLQHLAEHELADGIAENRAESGTAIIMDPHTGEILALANEPTFNPNAYRDFDDSERRNRGVQDLYEPGSTFKVVTASAALEEHVLPVDTFIDTNPGSIKLPGRPAITEDGHRNYGVLSFTDVIVKSSNIGAIRIGFKVGTERLSRFVSLYGFGHTVSPDFPGESAGIVWKPEKWTDSALASVSMGYQVGVTPLQMVAAVSSVANGGEYMEPRVVRAMYRDSRRYAVHPKPLRRIINPDTAATLTSIMEQVVERGTARRAKIGGYTIAGKTGTASRLVNGHYSHSEYNASFVGFMPSRNPVFAMIVVVNSPHGANGTHGGSVAAPIWQRIATDAIRYLGVPQNVDAPPPVLVVRHEEPAKVPAANGVQPQAIVSVAPDASSGMVPDLTGASAREALRRLVAAGLAARFTGDGFVVAQDPAPGAPIEPGSTCRVTLDRSPARHPAEAPQP